ncbi:MAG: heme-binding domain-containing protein [Bacteroidia bacterium]|nr:heme-binding domain-containing protein [Bacteroidia bacterium]
MLRIIMIGLLAIFIVMQFIQPARNVGSELKNIATVFPIPPKANKILVESCYDCHSNNTNYPWYSRIQPAAWWMDGHVKEGKKRLNFSEFTAYPLYKQFHKLEEVTDEIENDEMPLKSYNWIHPKMTSDDKIILLSWASATRDKMKLMYPPDSLVKPSAR